MMLLENDAASTGEVSFEAGPEVEGDCISEAPVPTPDPGIACCDCASAPEADEKEPPLEGMSDMGESILPLNDTGSSP